MSEPKPEWNIDEMNSDAEQLNEAAARLSSVLSNFYLLLISGGLSEASALKLTDTFLQHILKNAIKTK